MNTPRLLRATTLAVSALVLAGHATARNRAGTKNHVRLICARLVDLHARRTP
jgi:hypothetical protein